MSIVSTRWACANKDCPKKGLPIAARKKPDCSVCHKPLKES
jgi:hypothetical protein